MNAGLAYILHSPYLRTNVFPSPFVDIPFVQKTGFFASKNLLFHNDFPLRISSVLPPIPV